MQLGQAINDTLKIYYLDENYLELHRHWYTVFGKRTKPWKWKMKFRKLYPDEKELLEDKINELQIKYKKIEADSIVSKLKERPANKKNKLQTVWCSSGFATRMHKVGYFLAGLQPAGVQ